MKIGYAVSFFLFMGVAAGGHAQQRKSSPLPVGPPPSAQLVMTVSGFPDGGAIPRKFTCVAKGHGTSPAVRWTDVPPGTQSFILLVHDPEGHINKAVQGVTHWLIWNIPGTARHLPEGMPAADTLPNGAHQLAGHGSPVGVYFGPCAPPGKSHHYTWTLYALDTRLDLSATATRDEVMGAANGHVLAAAEWIGRFHR